jgi:hypothetical protein
LRTEFLAAQSSSRGLGLDDARKRHLTLPSFLVIGAMKAGTSSLHHYLQSHPQVFMSKTKELNFFTKERNRDIEWYGSQFADAGGALAVGETSPSYTKFPQFRGVPRRIAKLLPDVRLIYLVRHPVERMRSHYVHWVLKGTEREPIEKALLMNPLYLNSSLYALQIEQYLEHVSREQLLIVSSERLRDDRSNTMRRVYDFLGVEPYAPATELADEFHRSTENWDNRPFARRIRRIPGYRLIAHVSPKPAQKFYRRYVQRSIDPIKAVLSDELRNCLKEILKEDVRRLRAYMEADFDGWGIA